MRRLWHLLYALCMSETRPPYLIGDDPRQHNGGQALPSGEESGFPGCETVPMNASQFAACERHIEYWDARRDLAWMVRESGMEHDRPLSRLAALVYRMAQIRGADIECCSTVSLHDRGREGDDADDDVRVMEADQTIYLDAARAWTVRSPVLVRRGEGPDVALEVDHTTDARRRKLDVYEEWAIPEVWIEVPDAPARSRPKSRRSGLTIHALNACTQRYEEAAASSVLPGWTAEEIHLALNEAVVSPRTWAAVERVGRALGEKEGTEPTHDPIHRRQLLAVQAEGRAEGRKAGRAEGRPKSGQERRQGRSHCQREGCHGVHHPRPARHRHSACVPCQRRRSSAAAGTRYGADRRSRLAVL